MRRAYFLMFIVALLLFSAFAISFGWYYYAKQAVVKIASDEAEIEGPASLPAELNISETYVPAKKAAITIGEKAAYRKPFGAQIVANVKNTGSVSGSADIYAELLYNRVSVANKTVSVPVIKAGEEKAVEINITYFKQWSSFDVRQI